ncbi:MAG: LytTR family transcriptional regulator DNA-binding domain-containing protein [Pseudonocardia sp.]
MLRSWYRCRDTHHVDPTAPSRPAHTTHDPAAPRYADVYDLLGELAADIVRGVGNCLATVSDAQARILRAATAPELRPLAARSDLEPDALWPESRHGTNGMGTAVLQERPVVVRGPEHWRQDMHGWTCLGVALHDPVTGRPVGALNISSHSEPRITGLVEKLAAELEPVRRRLLRNAFGDAMTVAERFAQETFTRRGRVLGLDVAGNIITASEEVRREVRGLAPGFLLDPASRRGRALTPLHTVAARSAPLAAKDPAWTGTAVIGRPFGRPDIFGITPVHGAAGVVGWILVSRGRAADQDVAVTPAEATRSNPTRITAFSGDSVLLLDPSEIRYAEASRHTVWLVTDCGRVRATAKGMLNVERELARYGFVRVHRSFVVNPERVRRVHHQGHGLIALSTDESGAETIPVSRRSTETVRRLLGL